MKIMTYNIFEGGKGDFEAVMQAIEKESPDFLCINEANGFDKDRKIEDFAIEIGMPNFKLALCGENDADYYVRSALILRRKAGGRCANVRKF